MWDRGKVQQPDTSLFFYNSGKGYVATKLKRVSNVKEIFKYKSKSVKNPKFNNDESNFFANSLRQKYKDTFKPNNAHQQRQTDIKKSAFTGTQRTITNFTVFNPRLPIILNKQTESIHMKSLQLTEERSENEQDKLDSQKSEQLQKIRKGKKNIHLMISSKNLKSEESIRENKKGMFHFCNLELEQNVGAKKISPKKNKEKQAVRMRKKRAENTIADWHATHRKRVSLFEVEGPKAYGINENCQMRQTSKKRYNMETIYISEFDKKWKMERKRVGMKEREGSQKLGGWDNKSDSSEEYF